VKGWPEILSRKYRQPMSGYGYGSGLVDERLMLMSGHHQARARPGRKYADVRPLQDQARLQAIYQPRAGGLYYQQPITPLIRPYQVSIDCGRIRPGRSAEIRQVIVIITGHARNIPGHDVHNRPYQAMGQGSRCGHCQP
jgi:hypothetical protein